MSSEADAALLGDALSRAKKLLRKDRPHRWLHTQGVGNRAAELAPTVRKADRVVLIAAAWLHDIGYAPTVRDTGFHPLDGGLYLRGEDWDDRIAALVAHHSGARFVAPRRGLKRLMSEFEFEEGEVSDTLTYADLTVGPRGKRMKVKDRIEDARKRHGKDSPEGKARVEREEYLLAVADRVEQRLAALKRK